MEYIDRKKRIVLISILLIFLFIILYIAIKGYGRIENLSTGRTDIFNIGNNKRENNIIGDLKNKNSFENIKGLDSKNNKNSSASGKNSNLHNVSQNKRNVNVVNKIVKPINNQSNHNNVINDNVNNNIIDEEIDRKGMLSVHDDNGNWNSKEELKIFSNPAFNFKNVIAPGSHGIYRFIINNNESFNIKYVLRFLEMNDGFINLVFKLKRNGEYIIGDNLNWSKINNMIINEKSLNINEHDVYLLEWKWLDGANDVKAGFNQANYKLNIEIKAKS